MALTTLDPFPPEIRQHIFEYLRKTTHKPTLAALACVNRGLYAESIPRLYERVRLNASNAEAYFGRLRTDGVEGVFEEITAHKQHLTHYIHKPVATDNDDQLSQYNPSPIARKLRQIWRTKHVYIEDALAAAIVLEAETSMGHLRAEFDANVDGSEQPAAYYNLLDRWTIVSVALGESLMRQTTLFSKVWEGVRDMLRLYQLEKEGYVFVPLSYICIHLPPDHQSVAAAEYCRKIISEHQYLDEGGLYDRMDTVSIHNANPLDHMSLNYAHDFHIFLRPENSPGMLSHEASIGSFMFHYLNMADRRNVLVPGAFYFYNSMFTDVDRVSHNGVDFWEKLEANKKKAERKGEEYRIWLFTLKIFGPGEKVACPVCLETV